MQVKPNKKREARMIADGWEFVSYEHDARDRMDLLDDERHEYKSFRERTDIAGVYMTAIWRREA